MFRVMLIVVGGAEVSCVLSPNFALQKKFGTNNSEEVRARVGYMESIMRVRACPCNAVAAVVPSM